MACSIAAPALDRLGCFQALRGDGAARRALAGRLQPLQLPPGMTLCEEGDDAAACWVLQEGEHRGRVGSVHWAQLPCRCMAAPSTAGLPTPSDASEPHPAPDQRPQPDGRRALRAAPAGTMAVSCHREEDGAEEEELVEGPALLGEAALLGPPLGFPRQLATLRTAARCTLWRLDAGDFAAALRAHPQVGRSECVCSCSTCSWLLPGLELELSA